MGRRRAGTVAGDGILRTGTVLRFDAPMLPSAREEAGVVGEPPVVPGVGVLAAAARIAEHGERQGRVRKIRRRACGFVGLLASEIVSGYLLSPVWFLD